MKIVSIGDIHGKTDWKAPVFGHDPSTNTGSKTTIDDYDLVIFQGDYVDGFDVENSIMKHNLHEIIELKKKYPDKVILLLGNHDMQYLSNDPIHRCSGYRPEMIHDFGDLFRSNEELFQVAYQHENYLWTHAGVHVGWYKYRFLPIVEEYELDDLTLSQQINKVFEIKHDVLFDVGYYRGGRHDVGGPFWVDRRMVSQKPLKGYHQIVGHSKVKDIQIVDLKKDPDTSITFIDVLDSIPCKVHIINI